jgi:dihydropteroate synthase
MTKFAAILNLTPDSFSDGGKFNQKDKALLHLEKLLNDGANMIDIGAESTRPGAKIITSNEEWQRLKDILPFIIKKIKDFEQRNNKNIDISLDSYHPENIEKSLSLGVNIINDVSGFANDKIQQIAVKSQKKIILMHNLGVPSNPNIIIDENLDIIAELLKWANEKIKFLTQIGIKKENIIFDPGIGFGKNHQQNIAIIDRIEELKILNLPLYVGHSRKRFLNFIESEEFIGKDIDQKTNIITNYLISKNIDYVRIHDLISLKKDFNIYNKL